MKPSLRKVVGVLAPVLVVAAALVPMGAHADPAFYKSPLFGIATVPGGRLLVADTSQGIVDADSGDLVVSLPGISDLAPRTGGGFWAIASGDAPGTQKLYLVDKKGNVTEKANLFNYEQSNNPHPASIDSNPFDVVDLGGGHALVADAAGNDLLRVGKNGKIDLIAVLPDELVPTSNAKSLAGCPTPPIPENAEICGLPDMIPAEAVATSVAIGPDGAYYLGELKGFPAPLGESRVWRVEPNARDAYCGQDPRCSVALDGFTSIIDLQFGPDGRLNVAQFDDASWFAGELGAGVGGSVHACNLSTKACETVVSGVPLLTSIAFRCGDSNDHPNAGRGKKLGQKDCAGASLWGATWSLVPGQADVKQLTP